MKLPQCKPLHGELQKHILCLFLFPIDVLRSTADTHLLHLLLNAKSVDNLGIFRPIASVACFTSHFQHFTRNQWVKLHSIPSKQKGSY